MHGRSAGARPMATSFLPGRVVSDRGSESHFGFDGWNRRLSNPAASSPAKTGALVAVYVAKVRITVHAEGATIIREGHGSVKAAAPLLARSTTLRSKQPKPMPPNAHLPPSASRSALSSIGKAARQRRCRSHDQLRRYRANAVRLPPRRLTPIPRPYYGRSQSPPITEHLKKLDGLQTRHFLRLRRLRRQYRSPLRPRSTKAFYAGDASVVATSRIFASWPHSHVSCAAVILRSSSPTLCATKAWAPKSVTSSTVPLCRGHHRQLHQAGK